MPWEYCQILQPAGGQEGLDRPVSQLRFFKEDGKHKGGSIDSVETTLAQLGADGWELINSLSIPITASLGSGTHAEFTNLVIYTLKRYF